MVHAALLLLMLEAAQCEPRFTISLKRSTQNLQLSTRTPADYSIYRINSGQTAPSGLTGSAAFDPSLPIGSEFCCDAQPISQW
jgi:hypothetical protein